MKSGTLCDMPRTCWSIESSLLEIISHSCNTNGTLFLHIFTSSAQFLPCASFIVDMHVLPSPIAISPLKYHLIFCHFLAP